MDMDSESAASTRGRCRVCLDWDVDVVALSLPVCVFAVETTFSQILKTCCAVEISASDLKPQSICNHCAKTAEQSFTFRKMCQNADIKLEEELDGVNIKVESDELQIKGDQDEDDESIIEKEHEEDVHRNGIMATIKDEFPDCISICNTDGLTQLHSKQNTNATEKIVCKICKTYFTDWTSLEHHLENCYSRVCGICGDSFASDKILHEHILTHEAPITDRKARLNRGSLTAHERIHTGEKPYECSFCSKRFNQQGGLTAHERMHTGEKPYECSHCSKRFNRQGSLTVHERIHTGEKPYECSFCSKRFTKQTNLTSHEITHTGEKPYECSHCKKRFARHRDLTAHERIHTGEKPYECSHCSKRFNLKAELTRHNRTHTGEKPYMCSHCCKRFASHSNFKLHERTHTGEKPYKCSHCNKCFSDRSHLNRHTRTHTGEKPYECSHCRKHFARRCDLTVHERIHTGKRTSVHNAVNASPYSNLTTTNESYSEVRI